MKCIKSVKQTKQVKLGEVIRTSDEDAIEKVKGGHWVYVPKSDWKELKQTNKKDTSKSEEILVTAEETTPKKKKGVSKKELKQEKKRNK